MEEEEDKECSPDYRIKVSRANNKKSKCEDDLLDSALSIGLNPKTSRFQDIQPFFCDEASIDQGNMSDDGVQDSLVDPLEELEPNYKKGGGKLQKDNRAAIKNKKKSNKTGKHVKKYQHKTKNKYDPSAKKKAAKEKQMRESG